jgi:hypothetical protein
MTYSILSAQGAEEMLEAIAPSCIICDEAHNVAGSRGSARAKRFRRYVDTAAPQIIALSGTITRKSPNDYHYLAKTSLGKNNFLPNAVSLAEAWATLIDSMASSLGEFRSVGVPQAGPIMPLVHWAQDKFPEENVTEDLIGFRKAYALRLRSTPGVVASGNDELGVSLLVENVPVEKTKAESREGYATMQELIKKLKEEWLTPNDDEIEHAMHLWKWRYEIEGAGFYNELYWPEVEVFAKRKKITEAEAEDIIEMSKEYHVLQQDYARGLRGWLKEHSSPNMDTPRNVGLSMHNHGARDVTALLYNTWKAMKTADFEGRIDRDARAVRVCDFKVNHCLEYVQAFRAAKATKGEGLIIWHWHQEMGRWMVEVLKAAGIDALACPAGPQFNDIIRDQANAGRVIVASMRAHGTGKNLQHFGHAYFLQWPRDAVLAEQVIGRQHRNGQERDECVVTTCHYSEFDRVTFAATLNDAAYISQTLGSRQRLIYATHNPVPRAVSFTVLHEWGTQAKQIGPEARSLLEGLGGA